MSYRLYVWTDATAAQNGDEASTVAQIDIPVGAVTVEPDSTLTYVLQNLEPQAGVTYYLRMRAYSSAGLYSDYSNTVQVIGPATMLSGAPSTGDSGAASTDGTSTGSTGDSGSVGSGSTSGSGGGSTTPPADYEVHWVPSSSSDVVSYRLYVWTDATAAQNGDEASAVAQIDIPVSAATLEADSTLTYVLQNLQPQAGVTYYLRMRAYSNAGVYSEYSNTITAVGPATTLSGATSSSATTTGSSGSSTGSGSMTGTTSGSSTGGSQTTGGSTSMISVDLDGVSEYLASSAPLMVGVGERFTLSLWAKSAASDSLRRGLFALRGSAQVPGSLEVAAQGQDLHVVVYDGSDAIVFEAAYAGVLLQGEWQNLVVAYDAQLDLEPAVFVDGMLVSASTTSGTLAFSDGARLVYLGDGAAGTTETWAGRLGHAALWDQSLGDAEIQEIAARGHALDLGVETGAYHGQDALLHYWKPGADPAAPGLDHGPASVPVDLDDPSGNVDANDVAPEGPTLVP